MPQYSLLNRSSSVTDDKRRSSSFFKPIIQPKLSINQPNDIYEQEADAMADKVMRMPDTAANNNSFFSPSASLLQRKCEHCEEEEKKLHRKEMNSNEVTADASTESYIGSLSGGGRSLTAGEKKFFEPRFGYDFSNVKIHNDSAAAKSAQSINALAYTTGNNIVFASNQYQPNTPNGKKLLGHELTHVMQQQNNKSVQRQPGPLLDPSVSAWVAKISGPKAPDNCCTVCPANMGVNSVPGNFQNGIELKAYLLNNSAGFTYDVKRTKHGKVWIKSGNVWTKPVTIGTGNDDDSHNADECLIPQLTIPYNAYIYSADAPGFRSSLNPVSDPSATDAILSGNFIEFVRVIRSDHSTFDDPLVFNWHSMIWVTKNASGVWSINAPRSVIGTGHLASLDP